MARKTWDELSASYRSRLLNKGIDQAAHAAGVPLHGGRGKQSPEHEAFLKSTLAFGKRYERATFQQDVAKGVTAYARKLGPVKGREYMRASFVNIQIYEQGEIQQAHDMWVGRKDDAVANYLYYYHGVFGY